MRGRATGCCTARGGPLPLLAASGFTLLELMITVAIVGILAAIAYPSYQDSVLKGRRAEGRAALLNLLQQQERYYTQTGSYLAFKPGDSGDNGTTDPEGDNKVAIPFKTTSGDANAGAAYSLGAAPCEGFKLRECVMLSAEPRGGDDAVGTLTVSSAGVKGCTGTKKDVPKVCW